MTVRIKTSGSSSTGWTQIQSFFVRTSAAWSDMANVWIKTASSAWTKVFNKPNVPEIQNKVEITISTANSTNQTKKLTGKAYHWTLATSVTYRFRKSTNDISFSNLFSPETSVNPSSGSSHTNDTYTILQSDLTPNATNYFVYVTKATNSNAGTEAESVSFSDYIDMPRDITNLTALTPTVANSIPLSWSPVAQLQAPGSYEVFYGTSTTPTTLFGTTSSNSITVTGLQANTLYYFRILPWTASNARGYYGNYSNVASGQTLAAAEPQPFNTISFTKGFPSSSSQGIVRSTALSWNASTNATRYEIEYEGSNDNANWTNVQTFGASPYTTSTSQSASWGSPQPVGGYGYYYFMRARIRASNIDSATTVIGDGGAYRYATRSPPGQPSFGSISVTSTTASIPVNASSTQGSNSRYEVMEYQYRTSFTSYPGSWSAKSLSSGSGTISLSGLSASTTYYIKIRNRNFDEEYSAENLFKIVTIVKPGFIRVDADEVTYPLHVILRFELEEALINGDLNIDDLPGAWNDKMRKYLNITPSNYAQGCLQDIHWPSGSIGYFPSYTDGAIIASQLMKKACSNSKLIKENLRQGDFSELNQFLNKNLRNFGSLKTSSDLLMSATGHSEIQPEIFLGYLKEKYL